MKLIHLSDLHLGKRINGFSMLEDQKYILHEILRIIDEERPDAVLIAGDIYDKTVPSAEAVELFDEFLVSLARRQLQTFVISGNHDSPERLAFGNRLIDMSGIHLSSAYNGSVQPFTLRDEYGETAIYMLPYIKPAHVRRFFPDETVESYTDALRTAISHMPFDPQKRNVLVAHQFVTGSVRCESEELSVGGLDNVDASVFDGFDYVALGHIHGPQNITGARLRYCGTPLKYSFSESAHRKSVTVVQMEKKGSLNVRTVPLIPMRDLVMLRGAYDTLTCRTFYENTSYRDDYVHITLTDEEDIPNALGNLRIIYRNLMKLEYDNRRTRTNALLSLTEQPAEKSPYDLFEDFYRQQNNTPLSEEQATYLEKMIEMIWEDPS